MAVAEDEAESPGGPFTSAAVELFWALFAARKQSVRDQHRELTELYGAEPGLAARVGSFWPDRLATFDEMLVLAERAGLLTACPPREELVGRLVAAAEGGPLPPLRSETPETRAALLVRLDMLATDMALRSRYGELLDEVWSHLEDGWRASGVVRAEAAARRLAGRVAAGANWSELLPEDCGQHHFRQDLRTLATGPGQVTVVVSAFGGKAALLDLCSTVLVGLAAPSAALEERERTTELGRRLRAVADPTRLELLRVLVEGPCRIGELAGTLGLAQPTVSNHVKLLRESGIVRVPRRGGELVVDREALDRLMTDLGDLLCCEARSARPGSRRTST